MFDISLHTKEGLLVLAQLTYSGFNPEQSSYMHSTRATIVLPGGRELGVIRFLIKYDRKNPTNKWVEVEALFNHTFGKKEYVRGVGTALLTLAIIESILHNKRIRLESVGSSPFFYWKLGFRPELENDLHFEPWCDARLYNKLKNNLPLDKKEVQAYEKAKDTKAKQLGIPTNQLTLDMICYYSMTQFLQQRFERQVHQEEKLNISPEQESLMMTLPEEAIRKWEDQFFASPPASCVHSNLIDQLFIKKIKRDAPASIMRLVTEYAIDDKK